MKISRGYAMPDLPALSMECLWDRGTKSSEAEAYWKT